MMVEISKQHINQNDKSLFGVFLNQARLNAYITLCHISALLNIKTTDEDSLDQMAVLKLLQFDKKDAFMSQRAFELIDRHFPMLKVMYKKEDKTDDSLAARSQKYHDILTCLLVALHSKRNEYCHAHVNVSRLTPDRERYLSWLLYDCLMHQ